MHEPAGVAPSVEQLATWVHDARQRVIDLVEDLSDEQLIGPLLPTVNPLLWEIGHLAWFQELFVLRRTCGEEPILPQADALWDSGRVPHDTRWLLALPPRADTLAYMREVRDRVIDRILGRDATDVTRAFAHYTVFHEDTHTEAITYTRQTLGYPPPNLPGLSGTVPADAYDAGALPGDVEVPGATFLLGATRAQPFAYDNEKWAHPVAVEDFAISRAPVTQEQFAAFVDDGGYERAALWDAAGWAWRQAAGVIAPVYWRHRREGDALKQRSGSAQGDALKQRSGSAQGDALKQRSGSAQHWVRRHFDVWRPLEPHRPVGYLSWYEADAYCRWSGRRLPTEAEWELAATGGVTPKPAYPWGDDVEPEGRANLEWRVGDTVDVAALDGGDSPVGCRQMAGNVWEWTASTFGPYPNFERDAYADNSEPFFGRRKVLRGGAWMTRPRYLRTTLRNYFEPDERENLAGLRTCPARE